MNQGLVEPLVEEPPGERRGARGLKVWLGLVLGFGVAGLGLGMMELAGLAVLAGMFAAAQAADLDSRWKGLDDALFWIAPVGGAGIFIALAVALVAVGQRLPLHWVAAAFCVVAATLALMSLWRPFADTLARRLFRDATHTTRLAARVVPLGILLAFPAWLMVLEHRDVLFEDPDLIGPAELWGGLIGLVLLSLGGVGFQVRRHVRETLARLGIGPMRVSHLGIAALGVAALFAVNSGAEWVQRLYFPSEYVSDQRMNQMIAGHLTRAEALLLGLTAGVGEEISLRGALQPRLGLVLTSLLFAALHVQYSWFGMGVILILGMLLGWIRKRTNTTTAIAVHAVYDVLAVFGVQQVT
ncbi:MAG TPA: CPBP family intramembrane glutamic endopeptidase [Candidatus Limnocylindria bacterium]|nr:CPBP family intramembrane glutamic endopeptidase [Candidatus Limnocylindria bacterium]